VKERKYRQHEILERTRIGGLAHGTSSTVDNVFKVKVVRIDGRYPYRYLPLGPV
jgi:hypothetical protein